MGDVERGESLTQFAADALVLSLVAGMVNGLIVGAVIYSVIGAIFGLVTGMLVALVLWPVATATTRCVTLRFRSGRLDAGRFVHAMRMTGVLVGAAPSVYFAYLLRSDLSASFLELTLIALLGAFSGAWAGNRLANLQLSRQRASVRPPSP